MSTPERLADNIAPPRLVPGVTNIAATVASAWTAVPPALQGHYATAQAIGDCYILFAKVNTTPLTTVLGVLLKDGTLMHFLLGANDLYLGTITASGTSTVKLWASSP